MTPTITLKKIKEVFRNAKDALVVCHVDPDADTIGSMIAMALLLKSLRIKATMFSSDAIPGTYNFLPHVKKIRRSLPRGAKFDVAIAVDAGDTKRLGRNISLRKIADKVINIDHHSDNTHFGDVNLVGNVSSSAELIYDICGYLKIHITKDMAICLYTAIITDTGSFRYENTSVSTFNIAAQLVLHGAAPNEISNKIYETKSVPSLKVLALALNGLRTLENEKIVWACVTRDMIKKVHAENEELTGIIDHLRSVKSAEVAILFREESDGLIKINLRSKKKINVQKIANELGGGGHARAAGVSIRGSLSRVSDKVLKTVQKHLKRSK